MRIVKTEILASHSLHVVYATWGLHFAPDPLPEAALFPPGSQPKALLPPLGAPSRPKSLLHVQSIAPELKCLEDEQHKRRRIASCLHYLHESSSRRLNWHKRKLPTEQAVKAYFI